MQRQTVFSGTNKKNVPNICLLKFLARMLNLKLVFRLEYRLPY